MKKEPELPDEPNGLYYDIDGKPIGLRTLCRLGNDPAYRRVAEFTAPCGCYVSTVWLGIDHGFGVGPLEIFETMVFPGNRMRRYGTKEEAIRGHAVMLAKVSRHTHAPKHPRILT